MTKKRLPIARPLLSAVAAGVLLAGAAAETAPEPKAIVIGFVGGVLKHDDRRWRSRERTRRSSATRRFGTASKR